MTDLKIIPFETQYTQPVKDLIYAVLGSLGIENKYPEINRDTDLDYIEEKYSGRGRFWLAFDNEKLIGTIAIEELDQETAKLKRMFVLPEYQGNGVGQKLMDVALSFAKDNEYKRIKLNTDRIMKRAHSFYEKNVFVRTGEDDERFFYERDLAVES